jgi:malonate transporter and related proteins
MLNILGMTGPIFIIIGLGFLAVRFRLLDAQSSRSLGVFVIHFALPALLFRAMATRAADQLLNPTLFAHYATGSVAAFVLITAGLTRKYGLRIASALAVGASLSNSAFMGLPIAQALIGPQSEDFLAVFVFVENLILVPLLLILAELGSRQEGHWIRLLIEITKRLTRNPLVLAMMTGMTFSECGLQMVPAMARTIDLLSGASAPTALFYIGCSLAAAVPQRVNVQLFLIPVSKLILHPGIIALTYLCSPDSEPLSVKAAVLNAAMPMATVYPLLGQRYGQEGTCSATLVVTTGLSFLTITGIAWLATSSLG